MATTVNTTYDETTFVQSLNKEEKYAWDNLDEIQKEVILLKKEMEKLEI